MLTDDPTGRVACEVLVTTGTCIVAGEITTTTYVDVPRVARGTIEYVGYNDASFGFDSHTCGVHNLIQSQSPDISMGVDVGGAGDQGLMFGFACDETPELMPLPIMMAHKLVQRLSTARREGVLDFLRPDGKSQVSVEYVGHTPKRIEAVVISTQHSPDISIEELRREVKKHIIDAVVPSGMVDSQTKFHINPTGRFVIGGPHGDTGLTGRKIIVDTYGGMGRHGGGAFSGKDPTKVTGPRATWRATSPRTSWLPNWPRAAKCNSPTPSAWPSGFGDHQHLRHGRDCRRAFHDARAGEFLPHPARHHRYPETAPADLPPDRRFRPFRPHGRHVHVGIER